MTPLDKLPASIVAKAKQYGEKREHGWLLDDVEEVLEAAAASNLANLGGNAQFQMPDGTCDLYWVEISSDPRLDRESWSEYVKRCVSECLSKFRKLRTDTDFLAEGISGFDFIRQHNDKGMNPLDYLVFLLYFDDNTRPRGSRIGFHL